MRALIGGLPDMLIFMILYGFLVTGIIITVRLLKLLDVKSQKNNNLIILFIALLFNAFNFYIIYDLMTLSPQSISGNGNPHILHIFISILLFLSFCIVLSKQIFESLLMKNVLLSLLIITMTLTIGCFSIVYQMDFVSTIKGELYYPMGNWLNWWKDIHLNYLYFNPYTFLIGISISGLIAGILALIKKGS
ncbi:hypothetical protein GH741_12590 [Aquibacillus halophilus]|uniref:Uncharacterized protein n=1 Tax=Aquibacillus halophilus TaxID=930132 RepID=A0A6A8DKK3_9BACI|nr:hypothetical protein [Aquibacillus halophilus]MRH43517.1 hypothetical protein [Aquibacillus halophilus]